MTVYKYMSAEIGARFLDNWCVAFRTPACFNDPFDCHPGFSNRTEEERVERVNVLMRQGIHNGINDDECRRYAEYCVTREERDELSQARELITDGLFYITCFTRTPKHLLMWSHYAREHTGLLIGFREDCELLKHRLRPVLYSDTRPDLPLFKAGFSAIDEAMKDAIFVKGLEWAYEQEARVVLTRNEANERHQEFNPDINSLSYRSPRLAMLQKSDVEVLVFGCRYDQGLMKKTAQSLLEDPSTNHIKIFCSVPDRLEFKLNYTPLE